MKIKYLLAILLFFVVACNKGNNGQLSLTIKTVSSNDVAVGEPLQILFDFTEKSSVIDSIMMMKIRINQKTTETVRDTVGYPVPTYPKNSRGQIRLSLDYNLDLISAINPPPIDSAHFESDSLILKFVAKDLDNHTSDTVSTGLIVVQRTQ
ncbi:MAG: hypothetical protein C5B59_02025 [Bacteroidetes bacterium]|nr:MAG: hypothetical protein C5B59_02025 [Bacteroidota bacterium]